MNDQHKYDLVAKRPCRRVMIYKTGEANVLQIESVYADRPGPGDVSILHEAVGVNYIDIYYRTGLYSVKLPSGLGLEAVGRIEDVGSGVDPDLVGQRVGYVVSKPGSYSTSRVLSREFVVPIPENIDSFNAAAIMLKGMTVGVLRDVARIRAGDTVLWHAAAGGVGLIACSWLSAMGVRIIGTVSTPEKAILAKEFGCTDVIVYGEDYTFAKHVLELTNGHGVGTVFDSVGKNTFYESLDCLSTRGMLVSFGNSSGPPPPVDPLELSSRGSLVLTRPRLGDFVQEVWERSRRLQEVISAYSRNHIRILEPEVHPLTAVQKAHERLELRRTTGSIVLDPFN